MSDQEDEASVVRFPQSRVKPKRTVKARDLGVSALATQLGMDPSRLSGHWCSRCHGIWQGLLLEAECPVCGNRQG
ncbi:MAG: hypothetical protein R3F54_19485 [Alphaproteobacteria bacterium]